MKAGNKMVNFLMANLLYIFLAVLFVIVGIVLWKLGKKDIVKLIIYRLVCEAEQRFGSGTGQAKLGYVWDIIIKQYPLIAVFLSQKKISDWIEQACTLLKLNMAKNNTYLLTYIQEQEQAKISVLSGQIAPLTTIVNISPIITPDQVLVTTGADKTPQLT